MTGDPEALTPSVAPSSGQDIFVLDNIFALIDEYICADLSIALRFSLAVARRTIQFQEVRSQSGRACYLQLTLPR
jgi:hypothetical protein